MSKLLNPANQALKKVQGPQLSKDAIKFLHKHPEIVTMVAKHPEVLEIFMKHPDAIKYVLKHPDVLSFFMKHPRVIEYVLEHPDTMTFLMSNPTLIDWFVVPGGPKKRACVHPADYCHIDSVSATVEDTVAPAVQEEKGVDALSKRSIDTSMLALEPVPSPALLLGRGEVVPRSSLAPAGSLAANDRIGGVVLFVFTILMLIM